MAAHGCSSTLDRFVCESNLECDSEQGPGICETDGLCSFADPICASGRRYGSAAGSESGRCTYGEGVEEPDSGPVDAGVVSSSDATRMDGSIVTPEPDARPAIVTLKGVVESNGPGPASLTFHIGSEIVGTCNRLLSLNNQCLYSVEAGSTIEVTSAGLLNIVTGTCPSCADTPCSFEMSSSCEFVGIFDMNLD